MVKVKEMETNGELTQLQAQKLTELGFDKMADFVQDKMADYTNKGLILPQGYNVSNAVMGAAMIITQDEKMMKCNKQSISEAMVRMVVQGLNPIQKQCYFIPYGGALTLHVGTWGQETVLRRIPGVVDIKAQPIYKDDEIDYKMYRGQIIDLEHITKFENRSKEIVGAYAIIELDEEKYGREEHIEIMTMDEIRAAWGQGATKGSSPAHKNFAQEMAKKTVRNRAMKQFINSTTFEENTQPVVDAFQQSINDEYEYNNRSRVVIDDDVIVQDFAAVAAEPPAPDKKAEEMERTEDLKADIKAQAEAFFDSVEEPEAAAEPAKASVEDFM